MLHETLIKSCEALQIFDCRTSFFTSGESFLEQYKQGDFDLILLDIYMDLMTGLDVAKEIRSEDAKVALAFCTNSNEFAEESYDLDALYYLRKPVKPEKVEAMLKRIASKEKNNKQSIRLPDGMVISLHSLLYSTYFQRYVHFHTDNGDLQNHITQTQALELLSGFRNMVAVGQSDIVNFYRIYCLRDNGFEMDNGDFILIPRRLQKTLKANYTQYCFDKISGEYE